MGLCDAESDQKFLINEKWAATGFKQEKWMIEKFKEKILLRSSQSAKSTIVLHITFSDNFRKLSEKSP